MWRRENLSSKGKERSSFHQTTVLYTWGKTIAIKEIGRYSLAIKEIGRYSCRACAFSLTCPQTLFNKPINKKSPVFRFVIVRNLNFLWVCVFPPLVYKTRFIMICITSAIGSSVSVSGFRDLLRFWLSYLGLEL